MKQQSKYHDLPQVFRQRVQSWAIVSLDDTKKRSETKEVVRWGDYHKLKLAIPVQTVSDHILGLHFLMDMVIRLIEDYQERPLDERLLQGCVAHHDLPEIWLHRHRTTPYDISATRKSVVNDLAENTAHTEAFAHCSRKAQEHYRRVYLLQAIAKDTTSNHEFVDRLNAEDRRILAGLKHDRLLEGRLFRAMELLEYCVYSAYCTMLPEPIFVLCERVVPSVFAELETLADQIPGFRETLWTTPTRSWFEQFVPPAE